ncbi:winged helix-turn-helix domain-containing protein [Natrinema ejinorense]|uniref:Transcriptional regulator n=1 Tax=Natrinema ejinorense TaxID=373386 RepID=A0A2A5QRS9_9EURY|nr:winged helix-turn-helix domain-containing protein [Natrinema ejinorense]PCR89489.1 transcriptional regulator [Natrinema ejinorense]
MADDESLAPPEAIEIGDEAKHTDEWTDEMPGVDRVISVSLTVEQPRTADWIAERAEVSPTTARSHLERLVDLHILSAVEQRGAKTYYPDAAYQRFKEVSQLIEEHTRDEIETIAVTAKEDIEELRETYSVESADELRKLATAEDTSSREARKYFKRASEWDTHAHMVSIAEEALERYEKFSHRYRPPVDSAV